MSFLVQQDSIGMAVETDTKQPLEIEEAMDIEDTAPLNGTTVLRPRRYRPSRSAKDRGFGFGFGVLIAIAVFLGLYHFALAGYNRHLPVMYEGTDEATGKPSSWFNGDCGNSPAEAKARGCRFDAILRSWLPSACTSEDDLKDEEEFLAHNWHFWREDGTELPSDTATNGDELIVFTNFSWHLTHCIYVWRKLHRALLDGRNIDSYMANYDHTHHCGEMLLTDYGSPEPITRIFTKFPRCG